MEQPLWLENRNQEVIGETGDRGSWDRNRALFKENLQRRSKRS